MRKASGPCLTFGVHYNVLAVFAVFPDKLSAIGIPYPAEILSRRRFDGRKTAWRWLFFRCSAVFVAKAAPPPEAGQRVE
jgi:hypothetical protein